MHRKKIDPIKVIKVFLDNMPRNIKIQGVFLFGSYATGNMKKDSDLDLVVISPDFKKMDFIKRLELLSHIQGKDIVTRSVPMDIIGYTPIEFKNIDEESLVMRQAKREGKMLFV